MVRSHSLLYWNSKAGVGVGFPWLWLNEGSKILGQCPGQRAGLTMASGDALQRSLCFRFRAWLKPGVRHNTDEQVPSGLHKGPHGRLTPLLIQVSSKIEARRFPSVPAVSHSTSSLLVHDRLSELVTICPHTRESPWRSSG